jgi:hypothetical protein
MQSVPAHFAMQCTNANVLEPPTGERAETARMTSRNATDRAKQPHLDRWRPKTLKDRNGPLSDSKIQPLARGICIAHPLEALGPTRIGALSSETPTRRSGSASCVNSVQLRSREISGQSIKPRFLESLICKYDILEPTIVVRYATSTIRCIFGSP